MKKIQKIIAVAMVFMTCIINISSININKSIFAQEIRAYEQKEEILPFPVTIRDFRMDYLIFEPDNTTIPGSGQRLWFGENMVEKNIGNNRRPVFKKNVIDALATYFDSNHKTMIEKIQTNSNQANIVGDRITKITTNVNYKKGTYEDSKTKFDNGTLKVDNLETAYDYVYFNMNNLFQDVERLNTRDNSVSSELDLKLNADKLTYSYTNSSFFPMDKKGFGNEVKKKQDHNYHFTLESHTQFYFDGKNELTFKFSGDDDVWVYIDDKLVMDIGGIHTIRTKELVIKSDGSIHVKNNKGETKQVGSLDGAGWYNFDFFFMERHTSLSNLNITTNMEFKPSMEVTKTPYLLNGDGVEVAIPKDEKVYPGDTLYYKFEVENIGNMDLTNIQILDNLLNVDLTQNYFKKDNKEINIESEAKDFKIKMYTHPKGSTDYGEPKEYTGKEALNQLKLLSQIHQGEKPQKMEIECPSNFNYLVTEKDAQRGYVENTLTVKSYHERGSLQGEVSDTVRVPVDYIDSKLIKHNIDLTKSISSIKRPTSSSEYEEIYTDKDNQPLLLPGDKVEFKILLKNNSTSTTAGDPPVSIYVDTLSLEDILNLGDKYKETEWIFKDKDKIFNHKNFDMQPNEIIELTTTWTVPIDYKSTYEYIGSNHVSLKRKEVLIGEDSVDFEVLRPKLAIRKEVNGAVDDTKFNIVVKGDDNTEYNLSLKANEEIILKNLKYGVNYTVSETAIPMNYKLDNISNKNILFGYKKYEDSVTVTNIKTNDNYFSDKDTVSNKFVYKSK